MPDGGDALSGLRGCSALLCVGLISEAPSGTCGNRAQCQTDCRMAAMPYPAYVGAAFCYACLISEAPSGSCGNRAQCQTDCRMAAMPYPAYVGAAFAICRPDKRSAIRHLRQPCTMPDRSPDGGVALSGLRGCSIRYL